MNKILFVSLATIFLTACTTPNTVPTPTATPPYATDLPIMAPTNTPVATPSTSPTIQGKAIWETYEKQKTPDTAFDGYSIQYPKTWTKTLEENSAVQKLTLTKGNYEISNIQAGMGGGICLFDKDPDFQGPSGDYRGKPYVEIETANIGLIRRVASGYQPSKEFTTYAVCNKPVGGDSFQSPTIIGGVQIKAPIKEDSSTMAEIDAILKTLMKK